MGIEYECAAVPTVKAFINDWQHDLLALMGPFGSGKSSGCVMKLVKWGMRQAKQADGKRRARFLAIRNTYRQLHDTTIQTVSQWLPTPDFGDFDRTNEILRLTRLHSELEMEIWFRALDRPEHVANLLSLELTGAWINEAREVPWAIVKPLQGRCGRYPAAVEGGCVDPGIIMDTNPPSDDSEFYRLFEEVKPSKAMLYKQPGGRSDGAENLAFLNQSAETIRLPIADGARLAQGRGYYVRLADGADPDFIRVYVDGSYGTVKEGKPVYPEYDDALHQSDLEPVSRETIYRGWDFGLTPACVFAQVLPDGRLLVCDELTADSIGIDAFADGVLLHCQRRFRDFDFEDIGDPAGMQRQPVAKAKDEQTCFDVLRGKGIRILPGEQALVSRLGTVKLILNKMIGGKPAFVLHSRCVKLRKGFQGRYQYRQIHITGAATRYHDTPDKNEYSHPHDALQYICTHLFGSILRARVARKPAELPPRERVVGGWMGG